MASNLFCDIVEEKLLYLLPRQLRRPDGKFTSTERARLQASFENAWNVALALASPELAASAEKSLCELELKEHLRLWEMAVLVYRFFDAAAREKLASKSYHDYNDEAMLKAFAKIMSTFNERLSTERYGRVDIPEGAPGDLFTFFDMWQDDVNDCVSLRSAKQ